MRGAASKICSKQDAESLGSFHQVKVHGVQPYNSTDMTTALKDVHVDIAFSGWDIATEVYELDYQFQWLAIWWGANTLSFKTNETYFI